MLLDATWCNTLPTAPGARACPEKTRPRRRQTRFCPPAPRSHRGYPIKPKRQLYSADWPSREVAPSNQDSSVFGCAEKVVSRRHARRRQRHHPPSVENHISRETRGTSMSPTGLNGGRRRAWRNKCRFRVFWAAAAPCFETVRCATRHRSTRGAARRPSAGKTKLEKGPGKPHGRVALEPCADHNRGRSCRPTRARAAGEALRSRRRPSINTRRGNRRTA
jgi:hypothetical protein